MGISSKSSSIEGSTNNPRVKVYINKKENSAIFEIKMVDYVRLWTRKTINLLGSTKDKNGEYLCQ